MKKEKQRMEDERGNEGKEKKDKRNKLTKEMKIRPSQ